MIKAQELRLGNLVLDYGIIVPVNHLMLSRLVGIEDEGKKCINLSPILITEDWLVKFGFRKCSGSRTYEKFPVQVHFGDDGRLYVTLEFDSTVTGSYSYDTDCEYVHQLQNLYYALTGEELTIKE